MSEVISVRKSILALRKERRRREPRRTRKASCSARRAESTLSRRAKVDCRSSEGASTSRVTSAELRSRFHQSGMPARMSKIGRVVRQNTARCVEKICDARLSWREMEGQAVAEQRSDYPRVIPGMNSDGITRPALAGMPALFLTYAQSPIAQLVTNKESGEIQVRMLGRTAETLATARPLHRSSGARQSDFAMVEPPVVMMWR